MAASLCEASGNRSLVIFPGALGDLICLGPVLRVLSRRSSEGQSGTTLELMARAELASFAVGRMGIARAHSIDRREIAGLFAADGDIATAAGFFGGFGRIYSFFAAEDSLFRSNLVSAATPATVSFHRFRPNGEGHIARTYLDEIAEGGAPLDSHIDILPEDIDGARAAIAGLGFHVARIVLIFPGSGGIHKNCPAENFVAMASMLAPPLQPIVVFGPAEHAMAPTIAPQLNSLRIPWISTPPLGALAGLCRLAAAFVGNDSGVSHLAAAAGTPGIAIFGSTDPDRWRPLGNVRIVRASNLVNPSVSELVSQVREQTKIPRS